MPRKFKWNAWDYDCDGEAYIIAKDECPNAADVPDYICKVDGILPKCKPEMVVQEGWCKFQVRSDFYGFEGEKIGFYVAERYPHDYALYKGKRGWFPVWIVRKDEWY